MKDKDKDTIEQFKLIYDCLEGISAIHDNRLETYNSVINCLIQEAKFLVEQGIREIDKRKSK
jgi:hypothetical protein